MESSTNPNLEPSNPVSELTKNLETIFDFIGIEIPSHNKNGHTLDMMEASFAIDECEFATIPDGAFPIVCITKYLEPEKDNRWQYSISYGMQNGSYSRSALVLVGENPIVETSGRQASEAELQALANDFQRFAQI